MWTGKGARDWQVSRWKYGCVIALALLIANWDSIAPLVSVDWDAIEDSSCSETSVFRNVQGVVSLCSELWLNLVRAAVLATIVLVASTFAAKITWNAVQTRTRQRDEEAWQIVKGSAGFVYEPLHGALAVIERQLGAGERVDEIVAIDLLGAAQASFSNYIRELAKLGNESAPHMRRKIMRVARIVANIDGIFREMAFEQQGLLTSWDSALMPKTVAAGFQKELLKQLARLDQALD